MTRLHDRLGETQYVDMLTGEKKVTSLWMRNVGAHTRFKDGSGQLKTQSNSYVLQLGGDGAVEQRRPRPLAPRRDGWLCQQPEPYAVQSDRLPFTWSGHWLQRGTVRLWYANDADKTGTYVDTGCCTTGLITR